MWKQYFPNANIIGADINVSCRQWAEDRVTIEIGSQDDPEFLDALIGKYQPFIIIDDGSHVDYHVLFTFERLFPCLPQGGYYVIEDAYMHFRKRENPPAGYFNISLQDYFLKIASNKVRRWSEPTENHGMVRYLLDMVQSIQFVAGAIVIRKTPAKPQNAAVVAAAGALAGESTLPRHWFGAAGIIMARSGPLDRAEALIRRAIAAEPKAWHYSHRLGEILMRCGRLDEAITAGREATRLAPRGFHPWEFLAGAQLKAKAFADAAQSYRTAIAIHDQMSYTHFHLSQALEALGEMEEAIAAARRAMELSANEPHHQDYRRHLEELLARAGDGAG